MEYLTDIGYTFKDGKYIKNLGACQITIEEDDFGGILVNCTLQGIEFYNHKYDLNISYDSLEEFKNRFDTVFFDWRCDMLDKFQL